MMKFLVFAAVTAIIASRGFGELQEIVEGNRHFTTKIFKELLKETRGNFVVSPLSLENLLDLLQECSEDGTRQELLSLLNPPHDVQDFVKSALKPNTDYSMKISDKIYTNKNLQVEESFIHFARKKFGVDVKPTNFSNPGMILTDAFHFKANWSRRFDVTFTKKDKFYKSSDEIVHVSTLHKNDFYNYHKSKELNTKFVEIPFGAKKAASMVIILPKEGFFEDHVVDKLFVFKPNYTLQYVNFALPKFKIESKTNFNKILNEIGVKTAFSPEEANFDKISDGVYINQVIQKSLIEINEKGVEGSDNIYVIASAQDISKIPRDPKNFIADHPFVFYIKIQDVIVLAGRVASPK